MKAVILAAGVGSRLRPITNTVPKCMVSVNDIKIIDKQITNLITNGVNEIIIVAGYKYDILKEYINNKYPNIIVLHNSVYDKTNNMYSLFLTKEYIYNECFILMNADVYFDSNIIKGLIEDLTISKIACDKSIYLEESMKITINEKGVNHISKSIDNKNYFAVSIDVYFVNSNDSVLLFEEIENTIINNNDKTSWTEVALDKIFNKTAFQPFTIENKWIEIDNYEDLNQAEIIFKGDSI